MHFQTNSLHGDLSYSVKYFLQFLTFSAGGALATALMFVELNQTCNGSDHISLEEKHNSQTIFPDWLSLKVQCILSCASFRHLFTDLSRTMMAAVPSAVSARTRSSKSIKTSSHTWRGMMGVEDPPGITPNRLSQPPLTPPAPVTREEREEVMSTSHRVNQHEHRGGLWTKHTPACLSISSLREIDISSSTVHGVFT